MEGTMHQEESAVEKSPCDKNNNQVEESESRKLPKSEEKETGSDQEADATKEDKTDQEEESNCADEKDKLQNEPQEPEDERQQTDSNISESESSTDCNKETVDETKTDKQHKDTKKDKEVKEKTPAKTERKKSSKGKDAEVKSDAKKKGKTEEAEKPTKTQRKSGLSSSSLAALSRPRASARSSRASNKNDIIAKFQQGAPETPMPRNFKIQRSAAAGATGASIKQKMLQWCINKTRNYEGVNIENFSSSWCDGLAFCALIHRFFPDAFDFAALDPKDREKNFTLAFQTAETLADCCPLLEVSDMLLMGNHPDPMCVFTYVQSLCHSLSKIEQRRKEKAEKEKADKKEGGELQQESEEPEVESGAVESSEESQGCVENETTCGEEDVTTKAETDGEPLVEGVS